MGIVSEPQFSLDLAEIIFDEEVSESRLRVEQPAVDRFRSWMDKCSRSAFHARCLLIDQELLPMLSGPSLLQVARLIELRFPEAITNMPVLSKHLQHLTRANELAQVFMPRNLANLIRALEEEGKV